MQKHTKTYLLHFDSDLCEVCGKLLVDIHHIQPRSKFGKKTKHLQDDIKNLIGLCRNCHKKAEFKIEPYLKKEQLQDIHNNNLLTK